MHSNSAGFSDKKDRVRPEHLHLGESLASRLGALSGLAAEQLKGLTIADITKAFPYVIDPKILFFRQVCGTVVKTDPTTGVDAPVPFATVQVEDTDCSFLGYFPAASPWGWTFPFHCRREVIATALTDECGRFCVWIPRWDIDWVLRFRRERRCFGVIFERPSIKDLLDHLRPPESRQWPPRPFPEPDPWPFRFRQGELLRQARETFGQPVAQRLASLGAHDSIGASLTPSQATLAAVAPLAHLQPPLPTELKAIRNLSAVSGSRGDAALREARSATVSLLARQVNLDPKALEIFEQRERVGALKALVHQRIAGATDPSQAGPLQQLLEQADALVKKSVWLVGGDGWAYDIGFGGLDHVLASGSDVTVLVLDTEVYSNTGGQVSKATPLGAVAKFAAAGKGAAKKDLGLMAMTYGHVYVASVAMGARDEHTVRAFLEAESYPGPSLILAYSHCIAHGIDMAQGMAHQQAAVESGRWLLYRYDPRRSDRGENPLQLDSPAPRRPLAGAMALENRFRLLSHSQPERARELAAAAELQRQRRWATYQALAGLAPGPGAMAPGQALPPGQELHP